MPMNRLHRACMDPRHDSALQVLLLLNTIVILLISSCSAQSPSTRLQICHCLAHEPCFPGLRDWIGLSIALGPGKLLQARPAAFPCHEPHYDAQGCRIAKANWRNATWRSDQPGSAQHPVWDSYRSHSCLINSSSFSPCFQGSVPLFAVNVSSPADVAIAMHFARLHNIRLVIRNSGHDYLGRSSGRDSLSIWTHNLKSITFHDYGFLEEGCTSIPQRSAHRQVVTVGAGVQWGELYKAAQQHNRVLAGAFSSTVAASGGYVQGGGHSVLGPSYRFASDNAIQFEVVTPDGVYRVANRCQHQELFWALRGGGGGTFGVVLSTTYITHNPPANFLQVMHDVRTSNPALLRDFLVEFVRIQPQLADSRWGGSFTVRPSGVSISYALAGGSFAAAASIWEPLVSFANGRQGIQVNQSIVSFPDFFSLFNSTQCMLYPGYCSDLTGLNEIMASHLIPRSTIENSPHAVADAMLQIVTNSSSRALKQVLGLAVGGGNGAVPENSALNPAWRNSLWHLITRGVWRDGTSENEQLLTFHDVSQAADVLRRLTGTPGAYVNEADYLEPDWQRNLFGENYPRLLRFKQSIDPFQLLACHHLNSTIFLSKEPSPENVPNSFVVRRASAGCRETIC